MVSVKFGNRNYRIREVELEVTQNRIIASTALNKRLVTEDGRYTSDEARQLDELIYFFVAPGKLKLSDLALKEYVTGYCV